MVCFYNRQKLMNFCIHVKEESAVTRVIRLMTRMTAHRAATHLRRSALNLQNRVEIHIVLGALQNVDRDSEQPRLSSPIIGLC
jgi:ATP sulfurylase